MPSGDTRGRRAGKAIGRGRGGKGRQGGLVLRRFGWWEGEVVLIDIGLVFFMHLSDYCDVPRGKTECGRGREYTECAREKGLTWCDGRANPLL